MEKGLRWGFNARIRMAGAAMNIVRKAGRRRPSEGEKGVAPLLCRQLGACICRSQGLLTGTFQKGCGTESDNDGEMPVSGFRLLCAMTDSQ